MNVQQKVLIIIGPTASGKSALAVELARRLNGEVISADSRQVYRGLDIGTGKITVREMKGVRHHLLGVASPKRKYTAGNFVHDADKAIHDIATRGKLPIICGGTGFYIDALLRRVALSETPPDITLRVKLAKKSAAQLFALLKKKDSARAKMMDTPSERNNKVRLIRALEIAHAKGSVMQVRPASPNICKTGLRMQYDALWIGINPPFDVLEKKIALRLATRLKHGMLNEAKRLHAQGLSYTRMQELGLEYRSLARYLQGKISHTELEAELNRDIRRYAKHQLAYWKRNREIEWFKSNEIKKIERQVRAWL